MTDRNHKMDHKQDIVFEMIDILMTIFDCINIHHSNITDWICDLLSTLHESTPTVATYSDIGEEVTSPHEYQMIDFGNAFNLSYLLIADIIFRKRVNSNDWTEYNYS